ncbi:MAG: M23 family metallopeptidase [Proteobacteria bacterium]|nr:M23 family metallopeptidase [Pseudomonadota bacterium]
MKRILPVFVFSLLFFGAHADCDIAGIAPDAPKLCGVATQGGMLYGEAKGWEVYKADSVKNKEKISSGGVFVIGFGRDAPKTLKLMFCKEGGNGDCKTYAYNIRQREYQEQSVSVPDKFIKYSDDVQKRIDKENASIKSARGKSADDASLDFMNLNPPLDMANYEISGVFGSRRIFNGIPKSPHNGLDIAAPSGTPVRSVASGQVVVAADMYLTGKTVFVSHGHGITSAYFHLSQLDVRSGARVTPDTVIGRVGATGRASGPHLHLGLYWLQTAMDPALFIK